MSRRVLSRFVLSFVLDGLQALRAGACALALALAVAGAPAFVAAASSPALAQDADQARALEKLTIKSANAVHAFSVEVMRDPEQRARGLMFRRNMALDHGMLFDFERPADVAMWMKNTYLPLDMLFIDRRGRILNIAENTEPLSERPIAAAGPTLGVLELNAGTAKRLGIKAGDVVDHPMFRR